jgi:hypothetical protein
MHLSGDRALQLARPSLHGTNRTMPSRRAALQKFEAATKRAAEANGMLVGTCQTSGDNPVDRTDDDSNAAYKVVGRAEQALRMRVLDRFAEICCGHPAWATGAMVVMKENQETKSIDIWIVGFEPSTGRGNIVQVEGPKILSDIATNLSRIACGKSLDECYLPMYNSPESLWLCVELVSTRYTSMTNESR